MIEDQTEETCSTLRQTNVCRLVILLFSLLVLTFHFTKPSIYYIKTSKILTLIFQNTCEFEIYLGHVGFR